MLHLSAGCCLLLLRLTVCGAEGKDPSLRSGSADSVFEAVECDARVFKHDGGHFLRLTDSCPSDGWSLSSSSSPVPTGVSLEVPSFSVTDVLLRFRPQQTTALQPEAATAVSVCRRGKAAHTALKR